MNNNTHAAAAVMMCVYRRDKPEAFRRALHSVMSQEFEGGPAHIYLGVDGPLGVELDAEVAKHEARLHKVLRSPTNLGLAATLNRLIQCLDDEEFVFRMDSDDVSLPGRFAAQILALRAHPEIGILGTALAEVDSAGKMVGHRRYPATPEQARKAITYASPLAHPTVCFRRRVLEKLGGYPVRPWEDVGLWFEALHQGIGIASLPDVYYHFTADEALAKRRSAQKAFEEFRIYADGIFRLHGPTWRLLMPLLRLGTRLLPPRLVHLLYRSGIRGAILNTRA